MARFGRMMPLPLGNKPAPFQRRRLTADVNARDRTFSGGFDTRLGSPKRLRLAGAPGGFLPTNVGRDGRDAFASGRSSVLRSFQPKTFDGLSPFAIARTNAPVPAPVDTVTDSAARDARSDPTTKNGAVKRAKVATKKQPGMIRNKAFLEGVLAKATRQLAINARTVAGGAGGVRPSA